MFGLNGTAHRNDAQKLKGQIPFDYGLSEGRLQKCAEEQAVIRLIRQLRANGKTLRSVVDELNMRLVPTKNHGLWQAATVKKILDRVVAGTSA